MDAFAGAKAGCMVGAQIAWQNPEIDHSWDRLASLAAQGDAAAGIGAEGEFSIQYNRMSDKFIIHAKAGLICGPGLSGSINMVVYAAHIESFIAFVYHKIMNQNFAFIGFVAEEALSQLVNLLTKYILSEEEDLVAVAEKGLEEIVVWWDKLAKAYEQDDKKLAKTEELASGINRNPKRLRFTTPEAKGRFLYMLTNPKLFELVKQQVQDTPRPSASHAFDIWGHGQVDQATMNAQMAEFQLAIVNVLSYIQSDKDYTNVLQHMSLSGDKTSESITANQHKLFTALGVYGRDLIQKGHKAAELIDRLHQRVIYPKDITPKIGQKVEPNTDVQKYKPQTH